MQLFTQGQWWSKSWEQKVQRKKYKKDKNIKDMTEDNNKVEQQLQSFNISISVSASHT